MKNKQEENVINKDKYSVVKTTYNISNDAVLPTERIRYFYYAIRNEDVMSMEEYICPIGITGDDSVMKIIAVLSFKDAERAGWDKPVTILKGVIDEKWWQNEQNRQYKIDKVKRDIKKRTEFLIKYFTVNKYLNTDSELHNLIQEYKRLTGELKGE